jgi:DNA-directed RNA polymerase subunit RPC12/RpoP
MTQIIKEGPKQFPKTKKCHRCGTKFTYEKSDIEFDSRENDSYVVCPSTSCGAFISVTNDIKPKLF